LGLEIARPVAMWRRVSDRSRLIAFSDCRAIIAPTLVLMLFSDIDGVPGSAVRPKARFAPGDNLERQA
jgi:hypothetical protein